MSSSEIKSIATRSVQGSIFTVAGSIVLVISGFTRSVILARLLSPNYFGVVALAITFLTVTSLIQRFNVNTAYIQRQDDSDVNASTFILLRLALAGVTFILTLAIAPLLNWFYPNQQGLILVLLILALFEIVQAFNSIAESFLGKELHFRRLAGLDVIKSLMMTIVSIAIALAGGGIWALIAEKTVGHIVGLAGLWFFRPPKLPAITFDRNLVRWYFQFGKDLFSAHNLTAALDHFDDFWVGTVLGSTALGYYSRAYEFAHYPRRFLVNSLLRVFFPAFAKLQDDRLRLSQAFYRVCSLTIRGGFLVLGTAVLTAPEFVKLFLGDQWLPMVVTFQLMLVYTILSPLGVVSYYLFSAVGQPRVYVKIQLIQVIIFIPLVIVLARLFGINGVAVATDIMVLLGTTLLFLRIRQFIDFSLRRLFIIPSLGLLLGIGAIIFLDNYANFTNDWVSFFSKILVMTFFYSGFLLLWEWRIYKQQAKEIWELIRRK